MADSFTTEAFTLLAIGLAFIMLRTYARMSKIGMTGFKLDDYLMLMAAVAYTAETCLAYSVGTFWHGLANNGMTDAERKALDPDSEEYRLRVNGSKTQIAGWSTYTLLLWLLKASMCSFYLRLTESLGYRTRILIGYGLIVTTWITVLLSILLGCYPMHKNWQIYPDPGNFCQPAISHIDIFVTVVLNVVTDIYLMSIPLPMLWAANLPPAKKLGLMFLFSGGIFVTMAGILRCVLIITNPVTGAQQAGSWACRETFVAVVTSNVPMIFPLIRHWTVPILSTMRSGLSTKRSGTNISRSANGMIILEDKNPRRSQGPNPHLIMALSESQEVINEEQHVQAQAQAQHHQDDAPVGSRRDVEHQAGITKQVNMHVTEEEERRQGDSGSERSGSMELMDAIQGAYRGSYFMTPQGQPRPQSANGAGGSGGAGPEPSTTAMRSPLAMHAWDGRMSSTAPVLGSDYGSSGR